jgi:hypothetical protein
MYFLNHIPQLFLNVVQPSGELLSEKPKIENLVFVLLFFCFSLTALLYSKKKKMLQSMLNELSNEKGRNSIFFIETGNEISAKLLLCIQTSLLLSIYTYSVFSHQIGGTVEDSFLKTGICIGLYFVAYLLFLGYKRISYWIFGKIFAEKEALTQLLNAFVSLICFLGILMFIPVLLMFYLPEIYIYCYYIVLFCILLIEFFIIYKTYRLFFQYKRLLLYLFLYLCSQEILPLFLLYKGLFYLFNVVERNTLWL